MLELILKCNTTIVFQYLAPERHLTRAKKVTDLIKSKLVHGRFVVKSADDFKVLFSTQSTFSGTNS